MRLSLSQYCALDSQRNWVVSTGAGAGKTTMLTNRYFYLLEENPDLKVNQVLALTFTQKAAEEMKARVYQMINQNLFSKEFSQDQRAQILKIKEQFPQNEISTFHSFCFRLIKNYPVESQVDPEVSVLGEFERRKFLQESYREVFHDYITKTEGKLSEKNRNFLALLECWDARQIEKKTLALLNQSVRYKNFVQTFFNRWKRSPIFFEKSIGNCM